MIIELATLPPEIQQYIAKVEQGESISFAKNGKIIATINQPTQQPVKSLIERFSQSNPGVADIELELAPRQLSSKDSIEIFD